MSQPPADAPRSLLFGLLALQTGLVTQTALVAAFHAWTLARNRPMAEILVELGALDSSRRALIEGLVGEHLKMHGDDPEKSLAAIGAATSTRDLLAGIGDPDLDASLARVGPAWSDDGGAEQTRVLPVGAATSAGQRFRIVRNHARGGLGEVFVAVDSEFNREVALKEIQLTHAHDPVSRDRFLREAEITGNLEHPGIVPVYGLGTYADGRPFYAMRFIKGDSLKEAIAAFHADEALKRDPGARSLELRKLLRRFLDVCNAVAYAHSRGVIHRDLKPANIMLGPFGETLVVDWGLAKTIGRAGTPAEAAETSLRSAIAGGWYETQLGSAVGTPAYMSPEQAAGRLDRVGPASDVYSLGATLYCLLTGRPPFHVDDAPDQIIEKVRAGSFPPPSEVNPEVPLPLGAICLKAMAPEPEDRPTTAQDLANDLERWLADEPLSAYLAAVTHNEAKVREHPEKLRYREVLARVRSNLGNALHFVGQYERAEATHRTVIDEFQALTELVPDNPGYRERLATAYINLSWVLRALGRKDEAESVYAMALSDFHLLTGVHAEDLPSDISSQSMVFLSQGIILTRSMLPARTWWPGQEVNEGESITDELEAAAAWDVNDPEPVETGEGESITDELAGAWDVDFELEETGQPGLEYLMLKVHTSGAHDVAFSPDGTSIASASHDRTVRVWDAATGQEALAMKGHTGWVMGVAFSPDGKRIASASEDHTVRVWDAATGQEALAMKGHTGWVMGVAFSPDGKRIASASEDHTVRVWDAATGQVAFTLKGHRDGTHGTAFSPDGTRIASASYDRTVRVWDASTGQEALTLKGHTSYVCDVAFSPDGARIASASYDRTVRVWDASTGQEALTLKGHTSYVYDVAFSPDGTRVASASHDRTVRVWDASTGQEALTLKGHIGGVVGVAFSPDGNRIASASLDHTVRVWDAATGQEALTLKGHTYWGVHSRKVVDLISFIWNGLRVKH